MKTYAAYYSSRCGWCCDAIAKGDEVVLVANPPRFRGAKWRMYHPACIEAESREDEMWVVCQRLAKCLYGAVDARMIVDSAPEGHERALFFGRIEHGHRRSAARLWNEAIKIAGGAS